MKTDITFRDLQTQQKEWAERNFGPKTPASASHGILGVLEEIGELSQAVLHLAAAGGKLAHSRLKLEQGIRGTPEKHIAEAQDSIADIVVFLADVCNSMGWDFQEIVQSTWEKVRQRDWTANKGTGSVENT